MKKRITYSIILSLLLFFSCVEELDVVTIVEEGYGDALVIEATITDEMKNQLILLSRAYRLEDDGPLPESNAQIRVVGDNGKMYNFQETKAGNYESVIPFAAQNGVKYNLEIITNDNLEFGSSESMLSGISSIDSLYLERDFNENEEEGVSIYVDASDHTGEAEFYRYTYEETYKIIAPKYSPMDLHYTITYYDSYSEIEYFLLPKPEQQQICYNKVLSNNINLTNNAGSMQDNIEKYQIRFLSRLNTIISHRYSILVRQYVQSLEAYRFYQTLDDMSNSESLLSQSQPGFVNGNLFSISNPDIKVIGFFDVSSVDEKRIYFNYSDMFQEEDLPPYFQSCIPSAPVEISGPPIGFSVYPLADAIDQGFKYFEPNEDITPYEGNYDVVAPICGNCTVMGNNYPPDFWVE